MSTNRIPYENEIVEGDSLHILKQLEDESIDSIVTDPPYGYSFMNKDWDKAVVSVDHWKECLRVLKPGAFAFIMSSPRQDVLSRMIVNLQDAGFRTDFTSIYHTYASGFPKAANTSKLLQKRGLEKEELNGSYLGFQPKPALEVILVVMKPLSEKSFVDQALKNGKGVTWLDNCRIPFKNEQDVKETKTRFTNFGYRHYCENNGYDRITENGQDNKTESNEKGRFPANLLVSDDSLNDGKITKSKSFLDKRVKRFKQWKEQDGHERTSFGNEKVYGFNDEGSYSRYFDLDVWYSSQQAQFIITPKASTGERNKGLENSEPKFTTELNKWTENDYRKGNGEKTTKPKQNHHPTVKPLKLMSYLITMGSRPNDIILDPFCGSGTTLIAAHQLHRRYIGIELQKEYVDIANKRLEPYRTQTNLLSFSSNNNNNNNRT